jgi:hypothetical protein
MGRHPAVTESPVALLHGAMSSSARLAQNIRRALQREVKKIERMLRSSQIQPGQRLELMDSLIAAMTALDRSAEQCGRLLTQKGAPPIPNDSPSSEEIMRELTIGQAKHSGR